MIKNLPAKPETQVQFLGRENPLLKELATHSSILAWEILWTEEWRITVYGVTNKLDTTEQLNYNTYFLRFPASDTKM